jgi:SAM-dependent methyltransferase
MAEVMKKRWPKTKATIGDCQAYIPYPDGHFDRIIAIHVLEHLPNLPAFLHQANRLLNKDRGQFLIVIPCEGGLGYSLGRRLTSQRIFENRYRQPYGPFIACEHVNQADEVVFELEREFSVEQTSWYPLKMSSIHMNLCIGLALRPRKDLG